MHGNWRNKCETKFTSVAKLRFQVKLVIDALNYENSWNACEMRNPRKDEELCETCLKLVYNETHWITQQIGYKSCKTKNNSANWFIMTQKDKWWK